MDREKWPAFMREIVETAEAKQIDVDVKTVLNDGGEIHSWVMTLTCPHCGVWQRYQIEPNAPATPEHPAGEVATPIVKPSWYSQMEGEQQPREPVE